MCHWGWGWGYSPKRLRHIILNVIWKLQTLQGWNFRWFHQILCTLCTLIYFIGSGKTPACKIACIEPIINHLEQKLEKSGMLLDETSASGLFNLISSNDKSDVPILCIDEAYNFFAKLPTSGKAHTASTLSMDRLCKLYDGDFWYKLKGSSGKRLGVSSARISMASFTTPRRFLSEVWPKIVSFQNGLVDRILVYYENKWSHSMDEIEENSIELENLHWKIYVVYTKIFM